jgi:hypothetical protein
MYISTEPPRTSRSRIRTSFEAPDSFLFNSGSTILWIPPLLPVYCGGVRDRSSRGSAGNVEAYQGIPLILSLAGKTIKHCI